MTLNQDSSGKSLSILVVGSGTMGGGIAQVAAKAGCSVRLCDVSLDAAQQGKQRIEASLGRAVEKGYMDAATAGSTLSRIQAIGSLGDAGDFDAAIEAVREDLTTKRTVFQQLEAVARDDALLLTNTSMISITSIAEGLRVPARVAGCHFFNPVPRMALVEVIGGAHTTQETIKAVADLVASWGKMPVIVPDTPGFIVNRAFGMMINEAVFLVQEGVAPSDVDMALKLGLNHPMGPCELLDLVGIDVALDCAIAMWEQFDRAPKFEPCPLLYQMVQEGKLGRKSGQGFYSYNRLC